MTGEKTVKVSLELELTEDAIERLNLREILKEGTISVIEDEPEVEEKAVDLDLYSDEYVKEYRNTKTHAALYAVCLSEDNHTDVDKSFFTVNDIYDNINIARLYFRSYKQPKGCLSTELRNLWKQGLLKRIELNTDGRGRTPYGYATTEKGRALSRHMGEPLVYEAIKD